jgi:hypothetical protein
MRRPRARLSAGRLRRVQAPLLAQHSPLQSAELHFEPSFCTIVAGNLLVIIDAPRLV